MASLDSVRDKIRRAAEHLKTVETESVRYFSAKPGDVVLDDHSNPEGRVILKVNVKTPVPAPIPIIIGDAIQNLRSSLDYLVWELVLAANNTPSRKNQFPVCDKPELFDNELKRGRLDGVAPDAVALIKGLQPYHFGQDCDTCLIRILDNFCNINKHRRVLLAVLAAHAGHTEFIGSESGHQVQSFLSPRYDNAEIAVSSIPTSIGDTMQVKGEAIFFITFDERPAKGIEISICLNKLWHFVNEAVIPQFERFFV